MSIRQFVTHNTQLTDNRRPFLLYLIPSSLYTSTLAQRYCCFTAVLLLYYCAGHSCVTALSLLCYSSDLTTVLLYLSSYYRVTAMFSA